jgi:hypothetical protein
MASWPVAFELVAREYTMGTQPEDVALFMVSRKKSERQEEAQIPIFSSKVHLNFLSLSPIY